MCKDNSNLIKLFYDRFRSDKNDVAAIDKGIEYTYYDIMKITENFVNELKKNNLIKKNIALYINKSIHFIALVLAIWKTGGSYIPIDSELPIDRINYILKDSKVNCIICEQNNNNFIITTYELNSSKKINLIKSKKNYSQVNEDTAYVLYTSGSTGNPKGVKITYSNLNYFLENINKELKLTKNDTMLTITTISFDISILEMFLPLTLGMKLVIGNKRMLIDMKLLEETIYNYNVTVLQATPITWELLIKNNWKNENNIKILSGGDKLETELSEKLFKISSNVWNLYGPTETTIWSSINKLEFAGDTSIGKPLIGTNFYLFNENMQEDKYEGELYIGGFGVSKGYLNKEELTKQRFIRNPLNENEIIYKTGDIVQFKKGKYFCIGRNDFQIKINGHRIEIEEIEKNLKNMKEIETAVVIPDSKHRNIYAFVKSKSNELTESVVKETLRKFLSGYMIPKRVYFVDEIPMTFNNKIDRKKLLKKYILDKKLEHNGNVKDDIINIWSNIIGTEIDPNVPYNKYDIDSLDLTRISIEMKKVIKNISLDKIIKYKSINNILKHNEDDKLILGNRTKKILKDYDLQNDNTLIEKINETEKMMLYYYYIYPKSNNFQDCYIFQVPINILENLEIKYFDTVENIDILYNKYIFGENLKIYSKKFKNMIKYNYMDINKKIDFIKNINDLVNEVNDINEISMKLTAVRHNNMLFLIFNYPHIRIDEISFFKIVNNLIKDTHIKENISLENNIVLNKTRYKKIYLNKTRKKTILEKAKRFETKINTIIEYEILKAIKGNINNNEYMHIILNDEVDNEKKYGNNINICSINIKDVKNIKDFVNVKKHLQSKKDNQILISYHDIENLNIGSDSIEFDHIENNDFNINIEIYNLKDGVKILISLKNEDLLDLDKIGEKLIKN